MSISLCKTCGAPVVRFIKSTNKWWDWCSNKCMGADPAILEKKRQTNLQKFGVAHPMELVEIRDKIKETNLERHGYENPFSDKEVQKKLKQTYTDKFGVDNPSKNKEVIKKISNAAILRYADSKEEILSKRRATCLKILGVDSNKQLHISKESIRLMKDLEWLKDQHFVQKKSCQQIADELGVSATPILTFMANNGIDVIRHSVSLVEQNIREFVKTLTTDEIIFNDRSILYPKEIDIYFPKQQLGIEVNGVFWHSEERGKDSHYHLNKTKKCEDQTIQLLQIYDTEWNDLTKQEIIKSKLRHRFNKSTRIFARQCIIKDVDNKQAEEFLIANHLQGYVSARYKIGLFYKNELISIATFGASRYNKAYQLELLRYCNKLNHTVVGGLSKILKFIANRNKIDSIISYADRRWTANLNHNLYELSGFTFLHEASPNYKYFKINDLNLTLLSRNQFQKHLLKSKLQTFDSTLTEYENMTLNGYFRIWDCGNLVYFWTSNK